MAVLGSIQMDEVAGRLQRELFHGGGKREQKKALRIYKIFNYFRFSFELVKNYILKSICPHFH